MFLSGVNMAPTKGNYPHVADRNQQRHFDQSLAAHYAHQNVQGSYAGPITTHNYASNPMRSSASPTGEIEQTTGSYEQSRRQISSVIISEEILGEIPPEHSVRYIEVPVVEDVVKTIPVKSIVEIEKIVPIYEVEYVERLVEVPEVQYVDRVVESENVHELVRNVPGQTQIKEIAKEVIRTVPKIEYVTVEKIVEVPGEVIEIPADINAGPLVEVKQHVNKEVPIVVAQTIRPVITESPEIVEVDIYEYEPQIIPVDVHVATPIASKLTAMGAIQEIHRPVTIPAAQYNTILRAMNGHLEGGTTLPYLQQDGIIYILGKQETPGYVPVDLNQLKLESQTAEHGISKTGSHSRAASHSHVVQQSYNRHQYGGPILPNTLHQRAATLNGSLRSHPIENGTVSRKGSRKYNDGYGSTRQFSGSMKNSTSKNAACCGTSKRKVGTKC